VGCFFFFVLCGVIFFFFFFCCVCVIILFFVFSFFFGCFFFFWDVLWPRMFFLTLGIYQRGWWDIFHLFYCYSSWLCLFLFVGWVVGHFLVTRIFSRGVFGVFDFLVGCYLVFFWLWGCTSICTQMGCFELGFGGSQSGFLFFFWFFVVCLTGGFLFFLARVALLSFPGWWWGGGVTLLYIVVEVIVRGGLHFVFFVFFFLWVFLRGVGGVLLNYLCLVVLCFCGWGGGLF